MSNNMASDRSNKERHPCITYLYAFAVACAVSLLNYGWLVIIFVSHKNRIFFLYNMALYFCWHVKIRRWKWVVLMLTIPSMLWFKFVIYSHEQNPQFTFDTYQEMEKVKKEPKAWIPKWQLNLHDSVKARTYFLTAAFIVRIYENDKAKLTLKELKQWIHYILFAGVEHIYLCDHFMQESEVLKEKLKKYINMDLITYIPWNVGVHTLPKKVSCYQHIIDEYKSNTTWQIFIDMDEYPFIANDVEEGFLQRYLQKFPQNISEISMPNFLMLGQGDRSKNMTIERINRIESLTKKSNNLDKPISRPWNVKAVIHHNKILKGKVYEENGSILKMLHYWGSRLQNWGPDTPEITKKTVPFTEMRDRLAPIVRKSLLSFGELDAFNNSTGP